GALPPTALTLPQDKGSVALLDGGRHRHRKEMVLQFTGPGRFDRLVELTEGGFRSAVKEWARLPNVVLHEAAHEILCRAACAWAGMPLPEADVAPRTHEFAAMITGAGAVGPRQWVGQYLRQ